MGAERCGWCKATAAKAKDDRSGGSDREGWRPKGRDSRQVALNELVKAIGEFRKFTDQPLTLRGGDYAHAVQELNTAVDRANKLLQ